MEFDKIKVSLFISTLVLLVVTIGMVVFGIKQGEQIHQLKSELKSVQTELADKQAEQNTNQSESEKIIKDFYKTVYNYEKSQQEISMTTVKELATDNVYQELQNEINVNNSYSPQQNTIQKSSVNENEIKVLAYESKDNTQQYLVTAPIHQVFNGTKNDFEINQLIQIKNQKITQRTTIQLGEE
ncbi:MULTISPECIES: hypothetical protein [Enterococcus]|uniref:hypothetical protein n=1 Tax=Enterococcus TaxID=1350 RepID=UPI001CD3B21F|nr:MULTISPECIES: hypothetical protein [Enterococcus]UJJ80281.1 Hypothetical protein [Enterococcus faecalis]UQR10289.1 hypothetical protein LQ044_14595 [Enterococcus faecalis]